VLLPRQRLKLAKVRQRQDASHAALHWRLAAKWRYEWSKAGIPWCSRHDRFSPNSGHWAAHRDRAV